MDGTCYAPVNPDEDYQNDDKVVSFRGVVSDAGGTSETSGISLEIRDIGTYVSPGGKRHGHPREDAAVK